MTSDSSVSRNWELTLYDLHRKPQELVNDGTVIAVSPRSLKSELMCPICLDILKVTMTTKECLHRFCSECIITALRSGNKECPTCRKKLVSKRSLRRDPNFDAIISKIYPSRQEYEAHQDKILARFNRQHLNTTLSRSLEQQLGLSGNRIRNSLNNGRSHISSNGIPVSSDLGEDEECGSNSLDSESKRRSHLNSDAESGMETNSTGEGNIAINNANNTNHNSNDYIDTDHHHMGQHNSIHAAHNLNSVSLPVFSEIEVLLRPHPKYNQQTFSSSLTSRGANHGMTNAGNILDQTAGPIKYLKAPTITTVDHLCRYLTVRINLQKVHSEVMDDGSNFNLYTINKTNNTLLDSHMSIDEISREFFQGANCLDLYYEWNDTEEV